MIGAFALPVQGSPAALVSPADAHAKTPQRTERAKARAAERRRLLTQLRKRPLKTLRSGFLKRAAFVDLKLPLTVRLADPIEVPAQYDDQLELDWDTSTHDWPLDGTVDPTASSLTTLSGAWGMELDFGAETSGYSAGTLEATTGHGLRLAGTPFDVAVFDPTCKAGDPPVDLPPADQVAARTTAAGITFTNAAIRYAALNPFAQTVRGTLDLRSSVTLQRRSACGAGVFDSTAPPGTGTDALEVTKQPLTFQGSFKVAPAITSDGRVRFGRIEIDDTVLAQKSSFGRMPACIGLATVVPPATPECDPVTFPVRLKLKKLTADVIIGDALPPQP